ncbi:unnamed protein product [Linum tenue]|uniref:Uncharacterized protein n=1 Tax=Linum tenue TaxID=586396 RepID=A0AAV0MHN1_9ROSI|nr:unnamed protein product [Linum tenue]
MPVARHMWTQLTGCPGTSKQLQVRVFLSHPLDLCCSPHTVMPIGVVTRPPAVPPRVTTYSWRRLLCLGKLRNNV